MQFLSVIFLSILAILLFRNFLTMWLDKDLANFWSPLLSIDLTIVYYVIVPSFSGESYFGRSNCEYEWMFYLSVLLFYCSILIAFGRTKPLVKFKWNECFTIDNALKSSSVLFVLALVCYAPFRGFRTTIDANDVTIMAERDGFVQYFIELISILVASSCLALMKVKGTNGIGFKQQVVLYVILYFTLVLFIVGGFRYRIVILLLSLCTAYHLYPVPRKINYKLFVPLAVCAYLLFAIMDTSRSYGAGLNMEQAKSISLSEAAEGAAENKSVMDFSILVTDYYTRTGNYIGLEPVYSAILMPIPRTLFPWKPNAEYLKEAQSRVLGEGYGAAMLSITEAYIGLGLLGVILYGILFGWLSKKIWSNYRNNRDSIGAILLLALYNGFLYMWISRGYMPAAYYAFGYYIIMPFLITRFITRRILK